jgi:hypothetical protein
MSDLYLSCLTHAMASPLCRINRRPQMTLMLLQLRRYGGRRVGGLDHDSYHLSYFCRLLMFVDIYGLYCETCGFVVYNDNMFVNRFGICM